VFVLAILLDVSTALLALFVLKAMRQKYTKTIAAIA
jgi:hypothetical protein